MELNMTNEKSYRDLNNELEAIIDKLQSSDLDVDEIIQYYKKGISLINDLEKYLNTAQNKIVKINEKNVKDKK
jgi:exodeoxyribonuclease VII small subunit